MKQPDKQPDAPTSGPEASTPWRGFGGVPVELTDKEALVIAGNTIKRLRNDLDQCHALLRPMHQSLAAFVAMYNDDEDMPAVAIARDEIARCSKFLCGSSETQTNQTNQKH